MKTMQPSKLNLAELKRQFAADGFCIARGLFSPAEIEELKDTFAAIHDNPPAGFYEHATEAEANGDPLKVWPRVMHPHRFNDVSRRQMLNPGVMEVLEALFGEEAIAAQSMFYYKPPKARGQALHQDNFYLLVEPGTCVAAWTAVDDADAENGTILVVPKTGNAEIVCPDKADEKVSFTTHYVAVPKDKKAVLTPLKAGDTLFFNGSLIHGSGPNRSDTRFRRAFICHYIPASTQKVSHFYVPLVRKDGSETTIEKNTSGGACGTDWQGAVHA